MGRENDEIPSFDGLAEMKNCVVDNEYFKTPHQPFVWGVPAPTSKAPTAALTRAVGRA